MRGGGNDTRQRLVRNGADVNHGKIVLGQGGVEGVKCDTALSNDIVLLPVDLRRRTR